MDTLTKNEIAVIKRAVCLTDNHISSVMQNLIKHGELNREKSALLIQRALNAKVILEERSRLRMAPPPKDPRALDEASIKDLKKAGYSVYTAYDGDPPLYSWIGNSAAQSNTLQPPRKTEDQAWVDCYQYVRGATPNTLEADWKI